MDYNIKAMQWHFLGASLDFFHLDNISAKQLTVILNIQK